MTCDYCGKALSCADNPRHAPNGLPLFVCSKCYEQLKSAVKVRTPPVPMGRIHRINLDKNAVIEEKIKED